MADHDESALIQDENEEPEHDPRIIEGAEEDCCSAGIFCNPRRKPHRYIVLAFVMCFLSFGSYFCYDNPAALQDVMLKDLNITTSTYMQFYSWYSWPQVVLSCMGGFLIDRVFGVRLGAVIFAFFITLGQLIFALGAFVNKTWVMDVARFVFGIGGESLAVAQNTYASRWFPTNELNLVFGVQLSMSRVGSTVNMNSMQHLYDALPEQAKPYKRLGIALFLAAFTCLFSFCLAILMGFLDKRAHRFVKPCNEGEGAPEDQPTIKFKDVLHFPLSFWLISIICVAYYVTVFPYISLGLVFYERKYGLPSASADAINSVTYILSAAVSPFFGFAIDRTGKNIFWIMLGITLTMVCHAGAAFTFFFSPVAIAVIMGIGYSILASALWPLVAMVIPGHMIGTAYGIMQAVQNFGLAVIALAAGYIVDSKGYLILEVFFLMWLCVALIAVALLYLTDSIRGGVLNLTPGDRKAAYEKMRLKAAAEQEADKSTAAIVT